MTILINSSKRRGFTLVEIMIVVLILGMLMTIAVMNFQKSRDRAQIATCLANLKQIEGAKEQWGLEQKKGATDAPTSGMLAPAYLRTFPSCPTSGNYAIGDLATRPTCTVGTHALQ